MPDKDPFNYSLFTYLWVFALSMLGGCVSFSRKLREGAARAFNFSEFIGISGHMGSRAIFRMEKYFEARVK